MKKSRNTFPIDKSGSKYEKFNNTKRFAAGTDSATPKKPTSTPPAKKPG